MAGGASEETIMNAVQKQLVISSVVLFAIGLLIFFFSTGFIRNYGGDVVVVMFLYCLLSLIVGWKPVSKALVVFSLAALVELLQIFLVPTNNATQNLLLGSDFDVWDMVAYGLGLVAMLVFENFRATREF